MTRILVGPFNRVEGDLEVALEVEDGMVIHAEVTTSLYRGFEQILKGRVPSDALVIAPRICGICSVSQSMAAAAALRDLMGLTPAPNGALCAGIAHAVENMADHLTHFYLFFMPDFAREAYRGRSWFPTVQHRFKAIDGQAAAAVLSARSQLMQVMGLLAGKWPHSLAFQPGGTTQALDMGGRVRLANILSGFRRFLETTLFGMDLPSVLSLHSRRDLECLAETNGDFALFLRVAQDLGLDQAGGFAGPFLSYAQALDISAITEDVSYAWMRGETLAPTVADTMPDAYKEGAYSWAKAPRLDGRAMEVGAIARQSVSKDPLIADILSPTGRSSVFARVAARMIELAKLVVLAEEWVRQIQLKQPFCVPSTALPDGVGVGLVEAARGALGHWMVVKDGKIQRYQIIAPTTWNFSPRDQAGQPGPLEQALVGLDVGALGAKSPMVQHVVRSFDPCMVCTAH